MPVGWVGIIEREDGKARKVEGQRRWEWVLA